MFFDSVVFALMSFKAIQNFRTAPMPLLTTLVRDGALYFGVIFVISIANLVISVSVPKKRIVLEGSLAPALACFMSIIATRIVLNLRKQPFGDTDGDTTSPTPRSDVRFMDQGSYLDPFSNPRDKTSSSSITV
ncbi:hypothetical protein BD410DRAFT_127063 [Rickenella mellea]|uniref:Uncharacterized protein n=1 Tax=Rickenella mellea TaxID=50990 RepID=A0A4Y7Q9K8_9AGAM|nr:hypothetical protein BD410DRAFT_127063 [Rickenella mellea]